MDPHYERPNSRQNGYYNQWNRRPGRYFENQGRPNFQRRDTSSGYRWRPKSYHNQGNSSSLSDLLYSQSKLANNNVSHSKNDSPWSDEAQEEAKKKELSDITSRLKTKLDLWQTAENSNSGNESASAPLDARVTSSTEPISKQDMVFEPNPGPYCYTNVNQKSKENDNLKEGTGSRSDLRLSSDGETTMSGKDDPPKRTAHVPKTKTLQQPSTAGNKVNRTEKVDKQMIPKTRPAFPYPSAKDLERKMQRNLIGELVAMPKDVLKQLLDDPKMNPKIEHCMTNLVKENRLLLAQKFRNLAESKITSRNNFKESQFVSDVGGFIDADLAVDVSKLPPEFLKQLGAIFQLDFDGDANSMNIDEPAATDFYGEPEEEFINVDNSQSLTLESEVQLNDLFPKTFEKIESKPQYTDFLKKGNSDADITMKETSELTFNISTDSSYLPGIGPLDRTKDSPKIASLDDTEEKKSRPKISVQLFPETRPAVIKTPEMNVETPKQTTPTKSCEKTPSSSGRSENAHDSLPYDISTDDDEEKRLSEPLPGKPKPLSLAEKIKILQETKGIGCPSPEAKRDSRSESDSSGRKCSENPREEPIRKCKRYKEKWHQQRAYFENNGAKKKEEAEDKCERSKDTWLKRKPEPSLPSSESSVENENTTEETKSSHVKASSELASKQETQKKEPAKVEKSCPGPVKEVEADKEVVPVKEVVTEEGKLESLNKLLTEYLDSKFNMESLHNVLKTRLSELFKAKEVRKVDRYAQTDRKLVKTTASQTLTKQLCTRWAQTDKKDVKSQEVQTYEPELTKKIAMTQTEGALKVIRKHAGTQTIQTGPPAPPVPPPVPIPQQQPPTVVKAPEVTIYGVPVPHSASNESKETFLAEVKAIDLAFQKLNERKFTLFFKIASQEGGMSHISESKLTESFLQTVANGDSHVVKKICRERDVKTRTPERSSGKDHSNRSSGKTKTEKSIKSSKPKEVEVPTTKKVKDVVVPAKITEKGAEQKSGSTKEKTEKSTVKTTEKVAEKMAEKMADKVAEKTPEKTPEKTVASLSQLKSLNETALSKDVGYVKKWVESQEAVSYVHGENSNSKSGSVTAPRKRKWSETSETNVESASLQPDKKLESDADTCHSINETKDRKSHSKLKKSSKESKLVVKLVQKPSESTIKHKKKTSSSRKEEKRHGEGKKAKKDVNIQKTEKTSHEKTVAEGSKSVKSTNEGEENEKKVSNEWEAVKDFSAEESSVKACLIEAAGETKVKSLGRIDSDSELEQKRVEDSKATIFGNENRRKRSKPTTKQYVIDSSSDEDNEREGKRKLSIKIKKKLLNDTFSDSEDTRMSSNFSVKSKCSIRECVVVLRRLSKSNLFQSERALQSPSQNETPSGSTSPRGEEKEESPKEVHEDEESPKEERKDSQRENDKGDPKEDSMDEPKENSVEGPMDESREQAKAESKDDPKETGVDAEAKTPAVADLNSEKPAPMDTAEDQDYGDVTEEDGEGEDEAKKSENVPNDAKNGFSTVNGFCSSEASCDGSKGLPQSTASDSVVKKRLLQPRQFTSHKGAVLAVKIVGKHLLAACEDKIVYSYSLRTGKRKREYSGHKAAVTCLEVCFDKEIMLTGSHDGHIRAFNIKTSEQLKQSTSLGDGVQCLDLNWGLAFAGLKTGVIVKLNYKSLKAYKPHLPISKQSVLALKTMTEGPRKVLIVAVRNEDISIRDASTGLLLRSIINGFSGTVYSLLYNAGLVYCGNSTNTLYAYDFTDSHCVDQYECGPGVLSVRVIQELIFASSYDGNIYVFNSKTKERVGVIPGVGKMILSMEIYKNKQIVASSRDGKLECWNIPSKIRNLMLS